MRPRSSWMANLACLELHPHPVRADDLDHPDELRVDLDPVPGVQWAQIREVARVVRATLDDFGLVGWPKTSGSRGMHVNVRIERRWTFDEVRRAALALAREVERRAPALATSKWWKEERHGVFLDYNQNAKDRTVAAAYSVRPTPDARVSAPLTWDEIDDCEPGDFTLATMPARFADDRRSCTRRSTVTRARSKRCSSCRRRQEREGLGDAPWPPHYRKAAGRAGARAAVAAACSQAIRWSKSAARSARKTRSQDSSAGRRGIPMPPRILQPADVLVDAMRGRFHTWTRIRVNLQHVPEDCGRRRKRSIQTTSDDWGVVSDRAAAPKTFSSS